MTATALRAPLVLLALLGATACSSVQHGVVRTADAAYPPYRGPVHVSRTGEPSGVPLGIVQAYSKTGEPIEDLMSEVTRRAARLGADFVKIDRLVTRYEPVDVAETTSYECGTNEEPRTCTETHTTQTEVGITHVLGRAFRTAP